MERFSQPHHLADWCYVVRHEDRALEVVVARIDAERRRVIAAEIHQRVPDAEADIPGETCDRVLGPCHIESCVLRAQYAYEEFVPAPVGINDSWLVPEAFWHFMERTLLGWNNRLTDPAPLATLGIVH